eukprot:1332917-Rhodomonas_salina.2
MFVCVSTLEPEVLVRALPAREEKPGQARMCRLLKALQCPDHAKSEIATLWARRQRWPSCGATFSAKKRQTSSPPQTSWLNRKMTESNPHSKSETQRWL